MATTDLRFDVSALDRASQTFTRLGKAVERFEKRLDDLDGKRVAAEVDVDTKKADRAVGAFATNLQKRIAAAAASLPEIQLTADSSDADRKVARIQKELAALADQRVGVDIDARSAQAEVARLEAELRSLGDVELDIEMRANVGAAMAQLAAVNGEIDRLDGRRVEVKFDVDRSLADGVVRIAAFGRALGTLALPAAAVAAAPQLASIGAAAVSASGALGLIPAAGSAAALSIGTLAVGLQNMGDALDEDPEKAAEAVAKLAPAAQQAVAAVRGLGSAWRELQLDVQERLFTGLGATIERLGGTYLPVLRRSMGAVATSLNDGAHGVAEFLQNADNAGRVGAAFDNLSASVDNVVEAAVPLTSVFVDVLSAGSEVLRDLTAGAGSAAEGFAQMVSRARESGDLRRWIEDGVDQVRQLGRIARDSGVTLFNVFEAAEQAGAGLFDTVERVASSLREWTGSAAGNSALVGFFRTIRETVDAATPGVQALGRVVGDVLSGIGEGRILQKAAEAFTSIAEAVEPVLSVLGALATSVLPPLLDLLGALAPVLVPVAAGLLAIKAATAGWAALQRFPAWLMSARDGALGAEQRLTALGRAVAGVQRPLTGAAAGVRQLSGEMRLQRALASSAGVQLGRLGAAAAVFETSQVGAARAARDMAASYRSTSEAVRGFATAAGAAANTASVALGDRLATAAQRGVDGVLGLPAAAARAGAGLRTGLVSALGSTEAALRSLPQTAAAAGTSLRTGLATASTAAVGSLRSLGTAAADAGRTVATGLTSGVSSAVGAIRSLPTASVEAGRALTSSLQAGAVSAGRALSDGLRAGVTGALDAVRQLPTQVGTAITATGTAVVTGIRAVPDGIRTAFSGIGSAVDQGIGHIGRFASAVSGVGAAAVTGLSRALTGPSGLMAALGGPWGAALAAAGVALSIFVGEQAAAAQAAADHRARIEELVGTLDQYSGAVTAATEADIAREIGQRKLADGTTSFASALRATGIELVDFKDAAAGNEQALAKVNSQLFTAAQRTPGLQALYAQWKPRLDEVGISFDTLTAAAIGNEQAFDQLTTALGVGGAGFEVWRQDLAAAVGPIRELGGALGEMSGQVAEAQQQARDSAAAMRDFGVTLDAIKVGLGGLRDGAAPTELMAAGFRDLGSAARDAAQSAGESAAQYGGVAEGARQAAQSMQLSRDAFIQAATSAGLSADEAARLADQIGLIPAAAQIIFETNASGVQAELVTLDAQLDAVPDAKSITVNALSDEAQQKLRDLGFTVTTLPNGQILVTAVTDEARAALDSAAQPRTSTVTAIPLVGTAVAALDNAAQPRTSGVTAIPFVGTAEGALNNTARPRNALTTAIGANIAAVDNAINNAARDRRSTITVTYRTVGMIPGLGAAVRSGAGGGLVGYAAGGMVPPVNLTRGGVLPGYEPGRDRVPAILSRGEAVLVPELVRQIGPQNILAANYAASRRKPTFWPAGEYAAGGMVRLGDVSASRWEQLKAQGWKGRAGDRMEALYAPSSGGRGGGSLGSLRVSVRRMHAGGVLSGPGGLVADAVRSAAMGTRPGWRTGGGLNLGELLGELRGMRATLRDLLGDATLAAEIRGQTRALVAALRTADGAHSASQRGLVAAEMGWR